MLMQLNSFNAALNVNAVSGVNHYSSCYCNVFSGVKAAIPAAMLVVNAMLCGVNTVAEVNAALSVMQLLILMQYVYTTLH